VRDAICFSNFRGGKFSWDATVCNILDLATLDREMWPIIKYAFKCYQKRGHAFRITAARKMGGSGVHDTHPLRAVDAGTIGISREECRHIEAEINAEFPRVDDKPTAYWHDVGQGAHMHLQKEWVFPVSEITDNAGSLS